MALAIGADDKKKLYILLGLAGVLGVLVMVVINPLGIGKKKTTYDPGQVVAGAEQPTGLPKAGAVAAAGALPVTNLTLPMTKRIGERLMRLK